MATGHGDLYYASEKIGVAVNILATTHGSLQERLLNAESNTFVAATGSFCWPLRVGGSALDAQVSG